VELQHELERVQMQLQFEQERREWAQREAMLLRGQLLRYEGTMSDESVPKQSGQLNDTQGTTRQRQLAILVNQPYAVDETGTPTVEFQRLGNHVAGSPPNQPSNYGAGHEVDAGNCVGQMTSPECRDDPPSDPDAIRRQRRRAAANDDGADAVKGRPRQYAMFAQQHFQEVIN